MESLRALKASHSVPSGTHAGGELEAGQAEGDQLPVAGEIVQVFDVDLEQAERAPLDFLPGEAVHGRARCLAPAAAARLPEDAPDGAGRAGQAELLFEPSGAETGDRVPRLEDRLLELGRRFVRDAARRTGAFFQSRLAFLLVAPQPLAHGVTGAAKQAAGGADAFLDRRLDEAIAQMEAWIVGTNHLTLGRAQGNAPAEWSFIPDILAGKILVSLLLLGPAPPRQLPGEPAGAAPRFGFGVSSASAPLRLRQPRTRPLLEDLFQLLPPVCCENPQPGWVTMCLDRKGAPSATFDTRNPHILSW